MRRVRIHLKPRERRMAIVTFGVLLVGLLYVKMAEPISQRWLPVRQEARDATTELEKLRSLVKRRDEIQAAYRRVRDTVASGTSEQAVQLAVLGEVSRLAIGCGMEVDGVKPVRKVHESGLDRNGIELSGRCAAPAV